MFISFAYQLSLSATRLIYHVLFSLSTPFLIFFRNFFEVFFESISKRRKRDLNPRAAINDLLPFQGSPFSLLGISPQPEFTTFAHRKTTFTVVLKVATQRVGFEPTRPCGQTVFKTASLWPLRYLCLFTCFLKKLCSSVQVKYYH